MEGTREADAFRMRHEDAESAARLRKMLDRMYSTEFDGPRLIETAQDKLLEVEARKINEKVMDERPQDMEFEQPRPMSKLRKLSDLGMDRQGGGEAKRRRMDVS